MILEAVEGGNLDDVCFGCRQLSYFSLRNAHCYSFRCFPVYDKTCKSARNWGFVYSFTVSYSRNKFLTRLP